MHVPRAHAGRLLSLGAPLALLLALATAAAPEGVALEAPSPRCTYTYTVWNTAQRRSVRAVPVDKPRASLTADERGPFGCTPCTEDQIELEGVPGLPVTVCRHVAPKIARALRQAVEAGARISSLLGYRPSMSRGPADARGERTLLSLHAYGVAVDVNAEHNGLYDHCPAWGASCRLIKGGPWQPGHPLSLSADHPVVRAFADQGFRWGGALDGDQKDFMHLSPSGG